MANTGQNKNSLQTIWAFALGSLLEKYSFFDVMMQKTPVAVLSTISNYLTNWKMQFETRFYFVHFIETMQILICAVSKSEIHYAQLSIREHVSVVDRLTGGISG